jgi:hypothetical protein
MRLLLVLAVLALFACKKPSPLDEWSTRPRHLVSGKVKGGMVGGPDWVTTFTVELPNGMIVEPAYAALGRDGHYETPHLDMASLSVTIEDCEPPAPGVTWVAPHARDANAHATATPDGFELVLGPHHGAVETIHVQGAHALCCHAYIVDNDHEVADSVGTMLHAICGSLKLN